MYPDVSWQVWWHSPHSVEGQGRTILIWREFQASSPSQCSWLWLHPGNPPIPGGASWLWAWSSLSSLSFNLHVTLVVRCFWFSFMCLLIGFNSVSPTNFHQQAEQGWLLLDSFPAANPLPQACTESKNKSNTPKATLPCCILCLPAAASFNNSQISLSTWIFICPGFQLQDKLSFCVGKTKRQI